MNTLSRGAAAIRRAEDELRGLLAEAAGASRYDEVLVLGEWAKQLHSLLAAGLSGREDDTSSPAVEAVLGPPAIAPMVGKAPGPASTGRAAAPKKAVKKQRKNRAAKTTARKTAPPATYPQFLREGEQLIKIGWSKKEKKQYEHKAPKPVLDLLTVSLLNAGQEGRRFTTEDILPLQEGGDGGEVPSYQAYLCLAWIKSEGLIEQHGRQGYSLTKPEALSASIQETWGRLTQR